MTALEEMERAQQKALEDSVPVDNSRNLDAEETMLYADTPEEFPAGDETLVVKEGKEDAWKPTHSIGPFTVMQKQFANGLLYWVEEDGKRRRPTKERQLRTYVPPPDPIKNVWLSKDELCLVCAAVAAPDGRAEDDCRVAVVVDLAGTGITGDATASYVNLSTFSRRTGETSRILVQVPAEMLVMGTRLP